VNFFSTVTVEYETRLEYKKITQFCKAIYFKIALAVFPPIRYFKNTDKGTMHAKTAAISQHYLQIVQV
jgi:hypothetical protein